MRQRNMADIADRQTTAALAEVAERRPLPRWVITVPLTRPRDDLATIRGTPEFAETRYRIWRALHATQAVH